MMAQHVLSPATVERRLRPIYDNLEVGNNRKALQECEKVLKKHPHLLCARALKGLALLRLGRVEESDIFLTAVANERPSDDSTLQVLSFCYKELEQLDKIVELYNLAVQQCPGNEELLAHLFISHVRIEDFKAQQSVALQLYKAVPKNAYYFWAVMSVVLQGIRGPEKNVPEKRKLCLSLAQRMVDKIINENKLESEQEVFLYLHILKLQNDNKAALTFLNGPICEKYYPGIPISFKIELLQSLCMWEEINSLLKDLLKEEPDRWDYYKDYLTSCFELYKIEQQKSKSDEECMQVLEDCHEFLCMLIESNTKKLRGSYLARLELHKRMRAENLNTKDLLGNFCDLVLEYFRLFGNKSCCTHDVALFLDSISMEERQTLASKLLLESGISSTTLPQNTDQMQKHICALQISRMCGSHIDLKVEHLLAFYTALKLHYEHGLSSFGKSLLSTDMGPSDPYALLAANVMYDISLQEEKSDHLFEALCLLQYVLRNSTSNFHVKLLSLKIYHMFGCLLGAQEMYDYLDIKHIQLDSMGYVHCNLLPLCGRVSMGRTVFDATLKFFTYSYKERLEYISYAYRFCSFSKLEEFMNFKERLSNSLMYVSTAVEAQLCDLVSFYGNVQQNLTAYTAMSIDPSDDRISWHELSDNRDLTAIIRWDPVHLVNVEEERKTSFEQEVDLLHIRSLILRLVSSFIDLFHPAPEAKLSPKKPTAHLNANKNEINKEKLKEIDVVESLRDSWKTLFVNLRSKKHKPLSNRFIADLLPTRLHLMLQMPYETFFTSLADFVINLYKVDKSLSEKAKVVNDNVTRIVAILKDTIEESNLTRGDGLWRRREWQNKIAACMELLSLYVFVLSVFNEKFQPPLKSAKSKRKAENLTDLQISEKERSQLLQDMQRHVRQKLEVCDYAIQYWEPPTLPRDLSSFMADLSLKPEFETTLISDVASIFKESHELMVNEFLNLIKDKIFCCANVIDKSNVKNK